MKFNLIFVVNVNKTGRYFIYMALLDCCSTWITKLLVNSQIFPIIFPPAVKINWPGQFASCRSVISLSICTVSGSRMVRIHRCYVRQKGRHVFLLPVSFTLMAGWRTYILVHSIQLSVQQLSNKSQPGVRLSVCLSVCHSLKKRMLLKKNDVKYFLENEQHLKGLHLRCRFCLALNICVSLSSVESLVQRVKATYVVWISWNFITLRTTINEAKGSRELSYTYTLPVTSRERNNRTKTLKF